MSGWWAGNFHRSVVLYEYGKCVQILIADGMDDLEAHEWMEINVAGSYVGEGTPAFATIYRPPDIASLDW